MQGDTAEKARQPAPKKEFSTLSRWIRPNGVFQSGVVQTNISGPTQACPRILAHRATLRVANSPFQPLGGLNCPVAAALPPFGRRPHVGSAESVALRRGSRCSRRGFGKSIYDLSLYRKRAVDRVFTVPAFSAASAGTTSAIMGCYRFRYWVFFLVAHELPLIRLAG